MRLSSKNLDLYPSQKLYFSRIEYAYPKPVFPISQVLLENLSFLGPNDLILGLTGIANQRPFVKYLRSFNAQVKVIHYDDHHDYTREDFKYIIKIFNELQGAQKFIVTTEKDAVRILNNPYFPIEMRSYIYFIPIRVTVNVNEDEFIHVLEAKINAPTEE